MRASISGSESRRHLAAPQFYMTVTSSLHPDRGRREVSLTCSVLSAVFFNKRARTYCSES